MTPFSRLLLLPLVGLALLAGCDESAPSGPGATAEPAGPERIRAFATVYPLADVIRQVGGERVAVDWFAEDGRDWAVVDPPDATTKLLIRAKLVVTGGWTDAWADHGLDEQYRAQHVVRPEYTRAAREAAAQAGWREGPGRRAWWLDPEVVKATARAVGDRLTEMDPVHEGEYRRNADACGSALDDLSAQFQLALLPYKGRTFISLRPLWGALARRYGLEEVVVDADPYRLSDGDLRGIKEAARDARATALALDAALPPALLAQLQGRTGLRVMPLDPLGSSAPAGRDTYAKIMRYNLEQLVKGLE